MRVLTALRLTCPKQSDLREQGESHNTFNDLVSKITNHPFHSILVHSSVVIQYERDLHKSENTEGKDYKGPCRSMCTRVTKYTRTMISHELVIFIDWLIDWGTILWPKQKILLRFLCFSTNVLFLVLIYANKSTLNFVLSLISSTLHFSWSFRTLNAEEY